MVFRVSTISQRHVKLPVANVEPPNKMTLNQPPFPTLGERIIQHFVHGSMCAIRSIGYIYFEIDSYMYNIDMASKYYMYKQTKL